MNHRTPRTSRPPKRRRPRRASLLLSALTVLAAQPRVLAGEDAPAGEIEAKAEAKISIDDQLDALLRTGSTDRERYDDLYFSCLARDGRTDALLERLAARLDAEDATDLDKARLLRVAAQVRWRAGDLKEALKDIDRVMELAPSDDDRFTRASLLDATGRTADSIAAYEELLPRIDDPEAATALRTRLALMAMEQPAKSEDGDADAALLQFARSVSDPELRNRAAIVLAVVGRPKDALELFAARSEGSERFRDLVRMAEWAIDAGDFERAQEISWEARTAATLTRDRRYALTVLTEAYRSGSGLDALITRFAATADLDQESRQTWVDLLRETGQIDAALRLFHDGASGQQFTAEMRRQLLEMCRESGREDILIDAYRRLIEEEPLVIEWRDGLARHYLERGERDRAIEVWRAALADPRYRDIRLAVAESLAGLGLDDLAIEVAETEAAGGSEVPALLFLFTLHRGRGRIDEAAATLSRIDEAAAPDSADRMALAEGYEQLAQLDRAVATLQGLRDARGAAGAGEDLDMHLAWLLSEVGDEDAALDLWRELWRRVDSVARRRYVEDRMMTVASRVGKLADIAIELEERLVDGTADEKDAGLLVRLYSKANDPVSAAEIIEEFMTRSGSSTVSILNEKSRVYLACNDYHNFEEVMNDLIEVDEDNRVDHLRQLAMSKLERGRPSEAREVLARLRSIEGSAVGAEFEAGVLALSGMREEAADAYRMGLAHHRDRIEVYLLLANVLRDLGRAERAVGMFQHLAENADGDDLFTIAIDGLLNMNAPPAVLKWARRVTLERLTDRNDKVYLYQLIADLSEELNDHDAHLAALEAALPTAGERRASLLRELMELARSGGGGGSSFIIRSNAAPRDRVGHLAYGRRLIALREVIPPQVYLELGEAFLQNDEVTNAAKTFQLATDVPDYVAFQRQIAQSFERARFFGEALRTYERLLIGEVTNLSLLTKVAELHEQLGHDDTAAVMFQRCLDLLTAARPLTDDKKPSDDANDEDPYASMWAARNIDDWDRYIERVTRGVLVTTDESRVGVLLNRERGRLTEDLEAAAAKKSEGNPRLDGYPRVRDRAALLRRVAFAFDRQEVADAVDRQLLAAFPDDPQLLKQLVTARMQLGRVASARRLIQESGRSPADQSRVRYLTGGAGETADLGLLPLPEVTRLLLPRLCAGRHDDAALLLQRGDYAAADKDSLDALSQLFSAASLLGDQDLILTIGRRWIQTAILYGRPGQKRWDVEQIYAKCARALTPDLARSLAQSLAATILEDDSKQEQTAELLSLLPVLQKRFTTPIVDPDSVAAALESRLSGQTWGVAPLLELVAPEQRAKLFRVAWDKVAKTSRAYLVLNVAGELQEPAPRDLADLMVASLVGAIADVDEKDNLRYYIDSVCGNEHARDLALRIADAVIAAGVDHTSVLLNRAHLLHELGRGDDGLTAALDALRDHVADSSGPTTNDWETNSALKRLFEVYLPEHREAFLACLAEVEERTGPSSELSKRRLEVIEIGADDDTMVAAIQAEIAKQPEDVTLLVRLEQTLSRAGRPVEAVRALEQVLRAEPDERKKSRHRQRIAAAWETLRYPIRALAVLDEEERVVEATKGDEDAAASKVPRATLGGLKEAIDAGDDAEAHLILRRLWRGESPMDNQPMYFIGGQLTYAQSGYIPDEWPADKATAPQERRWNRGGLPEWVTAEPESDEDSEQRPSTYSVLLARPFGRAEIERKIRIMGGLELSRSQALFQAMADDLVARGGADLAFRETWQTISEGRGDKADYSVLLALLDHDPDSLDGERARAILLDVLKTVDPGDGMSLMRLARSFARIGAMTEATGLYRWCATLSDAGGRVIFYDDDRVQLQTNTLVAEVKDNLDGEARVEVIEQILAWADPGDDEWAREGYETLAIRTWSQILPPPEALERCRALCRAAIESDPPRRTSAREAAGLLARCGEVEEALRALSVSQERTDDSSSVRMIMIGGYYSMTTQALDAGSLAKLFPADVTEWPRAVDWLEGAADLLEERVRSGDAAVEQTIEPLVVIAHRLDRLGATDRARRLLDEARVAATSRPPYLLWIADLARLLDDAETASEIELELLQNEQLNAERIPGALTAVLASEGPAATLTLGREVTEYCLHPEVTDLLARAADEAGDVDEAERLRALGERAAEAQREIERRREEKQRARSG